MKSINKYIEYEIKVSSAPLRIFGAFADNGNEESKSENTTDDGYQIATADDIDLLSQFLGGGL